MQTDTCVCIRHAAVNTTEFHTYFKVVKLSMGMHVWASLAVHNISAYISDLGRDLNYMRNDQPVIGASTEPYQSTFTPTDILLQSLVI